MAFVHLLDPECFRPFRLPMASPTSWIIKIFPVFCCCFEICLMLFIVSNYEREEIEGGKKGEGVRERE